MKTFTVSATRAIYLQTEIKANSIDDAYEQINNGSFELDWSVADNDIDDYITVDDFKNG